MPNFKIMDMIGKISKIQKIKSGCAFTIEGSEYLHKVFPYSIPDKKTMTSYTEVGDSVIKYAYADTFLVKKPDGKVFKFMYY